jgi:cell division protein FtsI (penicillin-binding protein 3)
VPKQIAELGIKGVYQRKEYKRKYPEGEAAAHVVGFTNVETSGRRASSWPSTRSWPGAPGRAA